MKGAKNLSEITPELIKHMSLKPNLTIFARVGSVGLNAWGMDDDASLVATKVCVLSRGFDRGEPLVEQATERAAMRQQDRSKKPVITCSKKSSISAKKFIKILVGDIGRMIEAGLHYYAFIIICQGIEFLGSFYDELPFDNGKPDCRFANGLDRFPRRGRKYIRYKSEMYRHLRGHLVHQLRPSRRFRLTSERFNDARPSVHMEEIDRRIILVIETFYADFRKACQRVLNDLENPDRGLNREKAEGEYINIGEFGPYGETISSTGV